MKEKRQLAMRLASVRRAMQLGLTMAVAAALFACASHGAEPEGRWWRGCLHAHSIWSDGDVFPENAIDWYARHGYQFMALTDHNHFQEGACWRVEKTPKSEAGHDRRGVASPKAMQAYRALFGPQWVDECTSGGKRMARLKTLAEYRGKFEKPGEFLLLSGEEVSGRAAHLNVFNLGQTIPLMQQPAGQADPALWRARSVTSQAAAQSRAMGRPILVQLNHPGWENAPIPTDEVARIDCLNLMEINNDASGTSASLPGTERLWDAVLTRRMNEGRPPMLVTAGDDTHEYLEPNDAPDGGPGHGWVMVRAATLTPESLIRAMTAGDFYASSGVTLSDVRFDGRRLALGIVPQGGVRYQTEFIGTRKGGAPGEVLATAEGIAPAYACEGDELYVRAKVISSRLRPVRGRALVPEMAWTQPCRPGAAGR